MSSTPSPSRRGLVLALVALAAVLVAVALVVRARAERGEPVAVIGDSITEVSAPAIRGELRPEWNPELAALSGRRVAELQGDAERLAADAPEQAIVNLGTNDVLQSYPLDQSMLDYAALLDTLRGVRCVHVVTLNEQMVPADGVGERARAFNVRLRQLAAERRLDVVDWSAVVADELAAGEPNGAVLTDTVHPTAIGQRLLAEQYADALERC